MKSNGNNLSERVQRLTNKINTLHRTLELGKLEKIEELEKKTLKVEQSLKAKASEINREVENLETKVESVYGFIVER